jgi:hypothetical protein
LSLYEIINILENSNLEPIASWRPTASNLSIDYHNKVGSLVTGNKNTVKLIYPILDITLMLIFYMFGGWSSGLNRTFKGSDRAHDKGEVFANGNAPWVVEDNGNCMITGDIDTVGHCNFGDWP